MIISYISKENLEKKNAIKGEKIDKEIFQLIQTKFPDFSPQDYISISELNHFKKMYLKNLIEKYKNELEDLESNTLDKTKEIISSKNNDLSTNITLGEKLADKIASFGGSWTFIFLFFFFIMLWILINIIFLTTIQFDPYPFILLNLILSCLASIQAPIIMMSQNRQEQKDRIRAEKDYEITLKAELEIKKLMDKIDYLISKQNK